MKHAAGLFVFLCACSDGNTVVPNAPEPFDAGSSPPTEEETSAPPPPPDDAGAPSCEEGARDCVERTAVECAGGTWVTSESCKAPRPYCSAGRCIECLRGEAKCDGTSVMLCDADGAWRAELACADPVPVCHRGSCVECEPGKNRCNGRIPILCLSDGAYAAQAACERGTRCFFGDCVEDHEPTVTIVQPANGAVFHLLNPAHESVEIDVRAEAIDTEDGRIGETVRFTWSTDREDLQPGSARLLSRGDATKVSLYVSKPCQPATHRLKVTVGDTGYNETSAAVDVTIACFGSP
jgi:hypothetical protein